MQRYRDIIGRINYGLFLVVVALLPFPQIGLRYACVIWFFFWVLEGRWLSKPPSLREHKMAIPFILFGVWYGWKLLSGFWASDHGMWSWQMERYITFATMVPAGIWGLNERYDRTQVAKVLLFSCLAAIPIYLVWMGVLWDHSSDSFGTFFVENISKIKHRTFLSSVELMGAGIAIWHLYPRSPWKIAGIAIVTAAFCLFCGSRQIVLSAAAVGVVLSFFFIPRHRRKPYGIISVLAGLVIAGGVLLLHPRMQGLETHQTTQIQDPDQDNYSRLRIWKTALTKPQDYWAQGLGAGQSGPYLEKRYREAGMHAYADKHCHPHNQYLEELMELGVGGLLLFLLAWLSVPLCAQHKGRRTALLFFTLYVLNMCTECMFGMFDGIALWAVSMLFILLQSDPQREQ